MDLQAIFFPWQETMDMGLHNQDPPYHRKSPIIINVLPKYDFIRLVNGVCNTEAKSLSSTMRCRVATKACSLSELAEAKEVDENPDIVQ